MCKVEKPNNNYIDLYKIIKKRVEQHKQVFTKNKQEVFKSLFNSSDHLSVDEIIEDTQIFNRSTINRVLTSFEGLGIIECIIIVDVKRYELVYLKQPHYHLYCQECNNISEFSNLEIHKLFLNNLENMNFKATSFNVIINGVCNKCQK